MTSTLTKSRPRREANTFHLPEGGALRRALKAWFRRQRKAVVEYLRTGDVPETKNESIRSMGGNHRIRSHVDVGDRIDLDQRASVAEMEGRSGLSLKREPDAPDQQKFNRLHDEHGRFSGSGEGWGKSEVKPRKRRKYGSGRDDPVPKKIEKATERLASIFQKHPVHTTPDLHDPKSGETIKISVVKNAYHYAYQDEPKYLLRTVGSQTGLNDSRRFNDAGKAGRAADSWHRTLVRDGLKPKCWDGLETKREPDLPGAWPDWDDFQLGSLAMSERMTPYIRAIWDQQGKKFTGKIGLDPDSWSVVNPHTQAAIDKATLAFCKATQDTTDLQLDEALERTRSALTAGLVEHGESLRELTNRVKEIFTGAETWRARRIAGTESSRATHQAQIMAATDSGIVQGFEILVSEDACALCQTVARRAKAVKLGQAFAVIGKDPNYSRIDAPPIHPNCMCTLLEILDTDDQPQWADTLHDPQPEEQDYAPDEVPGSVREKPEPAPIVKPGGTTPGIFRLPTRHPMGPTPEEPIGDYLPSDEEIAKPQKPKAPKKPKLLPIPGSPIDVTEVQSLGGSTGAKLVKDESGKLWVMKKGANEGHLREEGTADELYHTLGLDVPRSAIRETTSGPVKFAEFHAGQTLGNLQGSDPAAYAAAVDKLRKGFVADALMGNWDVIGAAADNILVTPGGQVLRIDNGGSLRYRAMGSLKSASQFGPNVSELSTLRDAAVNPAAARIFGGIQDDEIKAQIKDVLKRRVAILKAAPDELKATLADRLDNLKEFGKPAKVAKIGNWKATPADQFKTFTTTQDADRYARDKWDAWNKSLTKEERDAVQSYKDSSSQLNAHHRNPSVSSTPRYLLPEIQKQTSALDAALERGKTTEPITVIRWFDLSDVGLDYSRVKLGMDVHDSGYLSTSINPNHRWGGQRFEIRVPKGVPAGYAQMATPSHQGEYEVILGREPGVFRVVELKQDAKQTIVLEPVMAKPKTRKKGP